MARKLRLEYPGACYHVINRGNYRADIFRAEGAKAAFESCLFEACARSNWKLHAFVLMANHYHLGSETAEPNLVAGMQRLQSTFANRFNKLRGERGHLFQGLADTPSGWKSYADYLSWQAETGPAVKSKAYVNLSQGWVLGTVGFKAALRADHALAADARAWTREGATEIRQAQWLERMHQGLAALGKTVEQAQQEAKSARWKLTLAAWMKSCTQASNGWLSERLHLGTPAAFSRNLTIFRLQCTPSNKLWKLLISISADCPVSVFCGLTRLCPFVFIRLMTLSASINHILMKAKIVLFTFLAIALVACRKSDARDVDLVVSRSEQILIVKKEGGLFLTKTILKDVRGDGSVLIGKRVPLLLEKIQEPHDLAEYYVIVSVNGSISYAPEISPNYELAIGSDGRMGVFGVTVSGLIAVINKQANSKVSRP